MRFQPGPFACLAGIWVAVHIHVAAACDPSVLPVDAPDGYRQRGPRCEGLFISRVSGPALDLVSLTYGKFPPDGSTPGTFMISVPPRVVERAGLEVHAVGIPLGLYYRMDADLPATGPLPWPSDEVLNPARIRLDQIGLYATSGGEDDLPVYVPVLVRRQSDPAGASAAATTVCVVLRPLTLLDKASWRFVRDGQAQAGDWVDAYPDSERLVINLPGSAVLTTGSLQVAWSDPDTGYEQVKNFTIRF